MKLYFVLKEDLNNKQASSFRCEQMIAGLVEHNIDVVKVNLYSRKKAIMIWNYVYLWLLGNLLRANVYVYGEIRFPYVRTWFNRCKRLILEKTEYPYELISDTFRPKEEFFNLCEKATSFITCSETLGTYYRNYLNNVEPVIVPLINGKKVEQYKVNSEFTITYCGYMGGNKDGVDDLIKSFGHFTALVNESCKLNLIGTASQKDLKKLEELVEELGLSNSVVFKGKMANEDVLIELAKSSVLALTRPDNLQAQGGFPSKLGEYLLTGKPVLCTRVGDIDKHFSDEELIFLNSHNPDYIASIIKDIFDNYEHYKDRAVFGQKAMKRYTPYKQAEKIVNEIK